MANEVLVLCDERDTDIAEAVRSALREKGREVSVVVCDAAAETLGEAARSAIAGAASIVVVVREGGRGNRLLHAVEDEAGSKAAVMSLMADASPDRAVSARTAARIRTLGEALLAPPARGAKPAKRPWPWIAATLALLATLVVIAVLHFWPAASLAVSGPPVVLTGVLSNTGWQVSFHLREDASRIEYKGPQDADFVSTGDAGPGFGPDRDARRARPYATMTGLRGKVPILVRYWTMDGTESGPHEVVFDTQAEAVSSVKRVLATVPDWISFRAFAGRKLCYFTTLLSHKYGLRAIRYGIDTLSPDRTLRFAPRDTPGIDGDDEMMIELRDDASSIVVELVYLDGTVSDRKRFVVRY